MPRLGPHEQGVYVLPAQVYCSYCLYVWLSGVAALKSGSDAICGSICIAASSNKSGVSAPHYVVRTVLSLHSLLAAVCIFLSVLYGAWKPFLLLSLCFTASNTILYFSKAFQCVVEYNREPYAKVELNALFFVNVFLFAVLRVAVVGYVL